MTRLPVATCTPICSIFSIFLIKQQNCFSIETMQLYYHLLNRVNQGTLVTSGNSGAFSIVRTPSRGVCLDLEDCLDTAGKLFT